MLLDDFDHWARVQPEAPALLGDSDWVSYGELNRQANFLAMALRDRGVQAGDRVGLLVPKNVQAVASMLGVLRLEAAYVPIDPRAPGPRVTQILRACSPRVLIGYQPLLDRLGPLSSDPAARPELLVMDATGEFSAIRPVTATSSVRTDRRASQTDGTAAAYVLYTSGSTGHPKGVVVSHGAACSFVTWARRTFSLGPNDCLSSFAPLSFDLSVFDIFGALSSGARVVLFGPEQLVRPRELVEQLARQSVTTIYAVPSTISLLERQGDLVAGRLPALRQVLYAGESFPIQSLIAAMTALPNARFFNLFGPTETNVCTYYPIAQPPAAEATQVPIGQPCEHLQIDLLDAEANPVPPGEPGELCVAGPSVMTGYFADPEATRAAFHPGERFADGLPRYRTGDHAIRDPDGRFWFRGRRDRQIKRRGYRIELGDVEASLLKHPQVLEASAVAESDAGETRILAFVSLRTRAHLSPLILRAHCGSLLPPYMVPDSVEIMVDLPRTLTGKIDTQQLRHRGRPS